MADDQDLVPSLQAYAALKAVVFALLIRQADDSGSPGAYGEAIFRDAETLAGDIAGAREQLREFRQDYRRQRPL